MRKLNGTYRMGVSGLTCINCDQPSAEHTLTRDPQSQATVLECPPLAKTPGYNRRLTIRLSRDKNGRPLAHYWGGPQSGRWFRMPIHDARMALAQDLADRSSTSVVMP